MNNPKTINRNVPPSETNSGKHTFCGRHSGLRRSLSLLLVFVLLLSMVPMAALAEEENPLQIVDLQISAETIDLGDTVTVTVKTAGEVDIQEIYTNVRNINEDEPLAENLVKTYDQDGDTITFEFMPGHLGVKQYDVVLFDTDGNGTGWGFWLTAVDGFNPITATAEPCDLQLGESTTLGYRAEGSANVTDVVYYIYAENEYETPADIVEGTDTYTPKEGGRYAYQAHITTADGATYIAFNRENMISVIDGLYPTAVTMDKHEINVGETVTLDLATEGEGEFTSVTYYVLEHKDENYGENPEYAAVLKTTNQFTPTKGGIYNIRAEVVNDKGLIYDAWTQDGLLTVIDGLYPTTVTFDQFSINLGETVTLDVKTEGEGSVKSVTYYIYNARHEDQEPVAVLTDSNNTFTPEKGGEYNVRAEVTNNKGNTYETWCNEGWLTVIDGLYPTTTIADPYELQLGESTTLSYRTEGAGTVVSEVYYIYEVNHWEEPYDVLEDTNVFTPKKGGQFDFEVHLTNDKGLTYVAGNYEGRIVVSDGTIQVDHAEFAETVINLGETVDIDVYTIGEGEFQSIEHKFRKVDCENDFEPVEWFTSDGPYFTPTEPGVYGINVIGVGPTGIESEGYNIEGWLFVVDDVYAVNATTTLTSAEGIQLGESVSMDIELNGTAKDITVTYIMRDTNTWEDLDQWTEHDLSTTYTPKEPGYYEIEARVTTDGSTMFLYSSWFYVYDGLYPVNLTQSHIGTTPSGTEVTVEVLTAGEGSVESITYYLMKLNLEAKKWDLIETKTSTDTTASFTVNESGRYLIQAEFVNDKGASYTCTNFWGVVAVVDGKAITDVTYTEPVLNKPFTVTAAVEGEGSFTAMGYALYKANEFGYIQDIYAESDEEVAPLSYEFTITEPGYYCMEVYAVNDLGETSFRIIELIEVKEGGEEEAPKMDFTDVPETEYYFEPVKWAVENGITTGTGEGTFSPDDDCQRAQVVTFLWRAFSKPDASVDVDFSDVDMDQYYAEAVAWAVANNITTGKGNGTFDPEGKCTRGQVVTFLWRANGCPEPTKAANFTDVPADEYYAKAVAWAAENGITTGNSPTTFNPEGICNRAQVVTFLMRALAK